MRGDYIAFDALLKQISVFEIQISIFHAYLHSKTEVCISKRDMYHLTTDINSISLVETGGI